MCVRMCACVRVCVCSMRTSQEETMLEMILPYVYVCLCACVRYVRYVHAPTCGLTDLDIKIIDKQHNY